MSMLNSPHEAHDLREAQDAPTGVGAAVHFPQPPVAPGATTAIAFPRGRGRRWAGWIVAFAVLVAGVAGAWSLSSKVASERVTVASQGTEISDLKHEVTSLTEDLDAAHEDAAGLSSEGDELRGALGDCRDAAVGGKRMLTLFAKVGFGRATVSEARAELNDYRDLMQICTSQANSNGVF